MIVSIDRSGRLRALYSDDVRWEPLGLVRITRASHVEPTAEGTWRADLSPVEGPTLGPFAKREEALRAEFAWIQEHLHQLP